MATIVLIHGLDRLANIDKRVGEINNYREFRVPASFGVGNSKYFPNGARAASRIGTVGAPNAAVQYQALYPGNYGNALKVVQNAPSGSSTVIAVTYSSGVPTVTITPSTTDTAASVVTAVNNHEYASSLVFASLPGTGASAPVASADASAVYSISQATGTSTAGTFTITIPGYGTTSTIAYNATGAQVATAVQTLIRTNPNNASATVTGSATTLPATTTLTLGGTGGANTPFPDATINSSGMTGGTYAIALTTWGRAAAGTMNGGLDSGTGQPIYVGVAGAMTFPVDVDDPQVARALQRNQGRYITL